MPTARQVPTLNIRLSQMPNISTCNTWQTKLGILLWAHLTFVFIFLGQLLDEVAMQCVEPSQCQVCIHEGQRISHGNKVILNHDDPNNCKIW